MKTILTQLQDTTFSVSTLSPDCSFSLLRWVLSFSWLLNISVPGDSFHSDLSNLFILTSEERWLPDPLASNTNFKNFKYYHKLTISKQVSPTWGLPYITSAHTTKCLFPCKPVHFIIISFKLISSKCLPECLPFLKYYISLFQFITSLLFCWHTMYVYSMCMCVRIMYIMTYYVYSMCMCVYFFSFPIRM